MNADDATVPMAQPGGYPNWPASGPSRPPSPARPARRLGCGVWLGVVSAFVAGLIVSAALSGALFAPSALPSTPASQTGGVFKIVVTDSYLDKALTDSAVGSLGQIQAHIQSNGHLTISGVVQGNSVAAGQAAVLVLAPAVAQGALSVRAVSGSVGGFPLPGSALTAFASAVNQQLTQGASVPIGGGQRLTAQSISFAEGQMTIAYA